MSFPTWLLSADGAWDRAVAHALATISARILVTMATLRLYQVAMGAGSWPAAACYVPCQACQPVAELILGHSETPPPHPKPCRSLLHG